jgi:hypothetical protein
MGLLTSGTIGTDCRERPIVDGRASSPTRRLRQRPVQPYKLRPSRPYAFEDSQLSPQHRHHRLRAKMKLREDSRPLAFCLRWKELRVTQKMWLVKP